MRRFALSSDSGSLSKKAKPPITEVAALLGQVAMKKHQKEDYSIELDKLWSISDAQYKDLWTCIETHQPFVVNAFKAPALSSISEALVSRDHLASLADEFLTLRRTLYSLSHMQRRFKPVDIFLSHAGEEKSSYAGWLSTLVPQREPPIDVFLDEDSLLGADGPGHAMLHAVMTCRVAVVIVSESFVQKKWPLLELSLLAARLRLQELLDRKPKGTAFVDDDFIDLHFSFIPDFFNREKGGKWVDQLTQLPLPLNDWPTGYRHEERLERDHAKRVIDRAIALLQLAPPKCDHDRVTKAIELYDTFCLARDKAFRFLSPTQNLEESDLERALRLTGEAWKHKWKLNEHDEAFTALRKSGRAYMAYVFTNFESFRSQTGEYLVQRGYADLTNCFLFTAPLEALNWYAMKKPQYNDVHFPPTYFEVVALLLEAQDSAPIAFLKEYRRVQSLLTGGNDPFPEVMQKVRGHILLTQSSPQSLAVRKKEVMTLV